MNIRDMKKRAGAFGLAALMSLSLAAPAFAADPTKEVTGTYKGAATEVPVLSMGVNFGDMEFTYQAPGTSKGTWDPQTHTYSGGGESLKGGWSYNGTNDITVANHSNVKVSVGFDFTSAEGHAFKGAVCDKTDDGYAPLAGQKLELDRAVEGSAQSAAPSKTVYFAMTTDSETLKEGDSNLTLGTITMSVARAV